MTFPSLTGLTREQVLALAAKETPKPMEGVWTLTAPDGRQWRGLSPIICVSEEQKSRVPALVAVARIQRGLWEDAARDAFDTLPDDYEAPR